MSLFKISPEKEAELLRRMEALGIRECDIVENFIRGSGHGGQKINKTSSCVHLIHKLSGQEVKCQRDRSQSLNRYLARRELCDRIENVRLGVKSAAEQEYEKIRRQKRKRSKRAKEKLLDDKHKNSERKSGRSKIRDAGGFE